MLFVYVLLCFSIFFFNDPPTTEIYTLSLHDALPICQRGHPGECGPPVERRPEGRGRLGEEAQALLGPVGGLLRVGDRKSTRLNSSHVEISYAVFCMKKKKKTYKTNNR